MFATIYWFCLLNACLKVVVIVVLIAGEEVGAKQQHSPSHAGVQGFAVSLSYK